MAKRTESIAVSQDEKKRIEDVAIEAFGTKSVSYGAVVSMLTSNYLSDDN